MTTTRESLVLKRETLWTEISLHDCYVELESLERKRVIIKDKESFYKQKLQRLNANGTENITEECVKEVAALNTWAKKENNIESYKNSQAQIVKSANESMERCDIAIDKVDLEGLDPLIAYLDSK